MKLKARTRNALLGTPYTPATAPALCLLLDYAAQRPALDFRNYYSHPQDYNGRRAYRQETAAILRDWQRVKRAVMDCAACGVGDAEVIAAAPRAFSGRLELIAACSLWPASQVCQVKSFEAAPPDCPNFPGYRLTAKDRPDWSAVMPADKLTFTWDYCTGQYWPTEYRKAVAAVLESAASAARAARPPRAAMPCSIAELRALNRENGGHWFDPGSMRFFGTRICSGVLYGRYFITRETNPSGVSRFSVRSFNETGDVQTVGEFHAYDSKQDALAALKAHLSTVTN